MKMTTMKQVRIIPRMIPNSTKIQWTVRPIVEVILLSNEGIHGVVLDEEAMQIIRTITTTLSIPGQKIIIQTREDLATTNVEEEEAISPITELTATPATIVT